MLQGELAKATVWGAHPRDNVEGKLISRLINPGITQAHNQKYDLVHPNIHLIYELLEHVRRADLQIQSCKISVEQDNIRISKRSPSIARAAETRGPEPDQ